MKLAASVTLAMLTHQAALADEAPMAVVEIIGSAPVAGLGIDRQRLPYPVQLASGDAMRRSGSLGEFMARQLNGVNVNDISGSPFQPDITYRGFRVSPVLGSAQGLSVYLDGVRVNEPFGDVVNWDMLPEAAIGKVQLVPGSNPVYGANTLGGALALTSKSGLLDPGGELEVSVSDAGRRRADLSHGVRDADRWHSFIAATVFEDDGWRAHSAGRLANGLVKVGHDNGDSAWSVSLLGGASKLRGNGLLPDSLYASERGAAYTFPDITRNHLAQATLNVQRQWDSGWELTAVAYARNSRRDSINGDLNDAEDEHPAVLNTSQTRQRSQGVSVNFGGRVGSHQMSSGVSADRSSTSYAQFRQEASLTTQREVIADQDEARLADSAVDGRAFASGVYASDTWSMSRASSVTAAARYHYARVGNTLRGQAREQFSYRGFNPSLGFTHTLEGAVTLFANIGSSNRVPTVIELGCADPAQPCRLPVGLQSDPYLKQVVSTTGEAGLRWQKVSASIYRTSNRDDILFLSAGPSHRGYFSNFARTRHQGIDISGSQGFGPFSAQLSYSFLDATYDAAGSLFAGERDVIVGKGTRIAGLPRHTVKLALDWRGGAWQVGADAQATSALVAQGNEDGASEWRVAGSAVINLRASYTPTAEWEIFVRVSNALDRRYETYAAVAADHLANATATRFVAPAAPRAITAGVRYRF